MSNTFHGIKSLTLLFHTILCIVIILQFPSEFLHLLTTEQHRGFKPFWLCNCGGLQTSTH